MKLHMFRTVPLSIIRSFFTVHTAMEFHPDPAHKLSANLYDIYHCCVYSEKTPDDGDRNCPKHVEFHSKNKFEKLVHLVGFIIIKFIVMHSHTNVKPQLVSRSRTSTAISLPPLCTCIAYYGQTFISTRCLCCV